MVVSKILGENHMKKLFLLAFVLSIFTFSASARVEFLASSKNSVGSSRYKPITTEKRCRNAGYTFSSCGNNYYANELCPYDSRYFKRCCENKYRYTKNQCYQQNLTPSTDSCGGLHECK